VGILIGMRTFPNHCLAVIVLLMLQVPAQALETDQFYAWGRPIADSGNYLNAWVRLTIQDALDSSASVPPMECAAAVKLAQKRLRKTIYQPIEMWAINNDLVDRIPRGFEENREYRENYLLAHSFSMYLGRWLNPSPTLEVNQVRFGTDKLAHFFSGGLFYYNWWNKHQGDYAPDKMVRKMLRFGTKLEWWFQGKWVTGVVSLGDLEANYQGFLFYQQLCNGDPPLLELSDGRWVFSDRFDIGAYISPEWDESWNANIYNHSRWKGVRVSMAAYCDDLHSPWVEQQRALYRERDVQTPTEVLVAELVAKGKLPDPVQFGIASVCAQKSE
jgi:hypothetical protein